MSNYRRSTVAGATFFFTVNLADRGSSLLTEHIARLRTAYRTVAQRLPFETVAICVLPEHLHAIWRLPDGDADFGVRWAQIKRQFSSGLPGATRPSQSQQRKREKGIWQRRFWEHELRDEQDLQRHIDYVHYNPVKHGHAERVRDWPYSSFHRYVHGDVLPIDWAHTPDERQRFGE